MPICGAHQDGLRAVTANTCTGAIVATANAEHIGRVKNRVASLALILPASMSGCSSHSSAPLTDGCYYAGAVPVLRVTGVSGDLLIPGNVGRVRVSAYSSPSQAGVTFEPGFYILSGPPLRVEKATELPRSSLMMKQSTAEPTIMAVAEPAGSIDLVKGKGC